MKKLIVSLFIGVLSISLIATPVLAVSSMRSGERVELVEAEIVDGDYFAGGETVIVSGTVNGDAYVAGSKVTVDGTIKGDLLIAGSDLDIRGTVTGDIRAGGGNVILSGTVGGNLTVGAGKVFITDSANLAGSIVAGAGDMTIAAPVGKGITAGVGTLSIDDKVGGDISYWSDKELSLGKDASVSGALTRHETPKSEQPSRKAVAGAMAGGITAASIGGLISLFLLGALILHFAPLYAKNAVQEMRYHTWRSLFVGFAALVLTPIFIVVLFVTLIGIPLAFIILLLFIISLIAAKVLAGLLIGARVLAYFGKDKSTNPYLTLGLGLVLHGLLMLIPVVGWIVAIGAYVIAFGSMLLHKRDLYGLLRTKKLI